MKKTLIELMLEANVKWPEGAEFAAQDKDYLNVDFYEEKPKKIKNRDYWADNGNPVLSIEFESLCRNWHQTIVTRSEYEAARGERYAEITTPLGKVNKTTEQKIKDMVFHQESIARYQEQIESNQAVVDKVRGEIAADLAALGWGEQPAGELEITDWRDLRVGDVILVESVNSNDDDVIEALTGKECVIVSDDDDYPICPTNDQYPDGGSWYLGGERKCKWKFIRRPTK